MSHLANPFRAQAAPRAAPAKRPALSPEAQKARDAINRGEPMDGFSKEAVNAVLESWSHKRVTIAQVFELISAGAAEMHSHVKATADPLAERVTRLERALSHALADVDAKLVAEVESFLNADTAPDLTKLQDMANQHAKSLPKDNPMFIRQVVRDGDVLASSREPQSPVDGKFFKGDRDA